MRSRSPVISGKVNANGTVAVPGAFTVQRTGTGAYGLSFLDGVGSVALTLDYNTLPGTAVDGSAAQTNAREWYVRTRQPGVAFVDMGFMFVATRLNQGG